MELKELYRRIDLPPEVIEALENAENILLSEEIQPCLERMGTAETAPEAYRTLSGLLREDGDHLQMLCCQLECARRAYGAYRAKGIPEEVYTATMKCFSRFIAECGRKTGRKFFDRGWWTYRQVSMGLFRVGALEYEFRRHEGENALAVHIPSDANLSPESVDASLARAGRFFQTYYPDYRFRWYTCGSWLLSPALGPLLGEASRIAAFQRRFTVLREDPADREFVEWLFQVPKDTQPEDLPERTSLQRKVKALLLRGGNVGTAYGVIER